MLMSSLILVALHSNHILGDQSDWWYDSRTLAFVEWHVQAINLLEVKDDGSSTSKGLCRIARSFGHTTWAEVGRVWLTTPTDALMQSGWLWFASLKTVLRDLRSEIVPCTLRRGFAAINFVAWRTQVILDRRHMKLQNRPDSWRVDFATYELWCIKLHIRSTAGFRLPLIDTYTLIWAVFHGYRSVLYRRSYMGRSAVTE